MKKSLLISAILMFTISLNAQIIKTINKSKANIFIDENFENGSMPEDWIEEIGDATQGWTFNTNASSSAWTIPNHTTYACINDDACNCDMNDVWLKLKPLDFTGVTNSVMKFDYHTRSLAGGPRPKVKVSIDGGNTWTELFTMTPDFGWLKCEIDLSTLANESDVRLAFHYSDGGAWTFGLAIDNVAVYSPDQKDLAAVELMPSIAAVGKITKPCFNVKNIGLEDVDAYQVTLTDGADYNETIEITETLAVDASTNIIFPDWTPTTEGSYTLNANIIYADDQYLDNNQITTTCEVMTLEYSAEAYVSKMKVGENEGNYGTFKLSDINTFSETGIMNNNPYPSAEEYNGVFIYRTLHNQTINIISPTDGSVLISKPIKNIGYFYPEGIAWDWDNNVMYLVASKQGEPNSFGTININTFEYTEISRVPIGIMAIDMADDGFVYGPSVYGGLYKIDPVTGVATEVGPLGININYGQDVSYDRLNKKLYTVTVQEDVPGQVKFLYGNYNLNTGEFKKISSIDKQGFTLCIVNPIIADINQVKNNIFSISPNPTNDLLNISTKGNYNVEIIDITGKIIHSENITNNSQINISSIEKGIYFVRLSNENNTSVMKILKN